MSPTAERCRMYLMPGMRCDSPAGHLGNCTNDEPDEHPEDGCAYCAAGGSSAHTYEPDELDEPMTRRDNVDGHEYVVTYGRDRNLHYARCDHPDHG